MKILNIIDDVDIDLKTQEKKKFKILNWNRCKTKKSQSIITYIESKDDFFKKEYNNFISKIKNYKFNNKTIYKTFKIKDNFSLWEMSLFEEKNIWKNPELVEIIKILALEKIIKEKKIKKIILFSINKELKNNILSLIKNIDIELFLKINI